MRKGISEGQNRDTGRSRGPRARYTGVYKEQWSSARIDRVTALVISALESENNKPRNKEVHDRAADSLSSLHKCKGPNETENLDHSEPGRKMGGIIRKIR
jgi:hypothetical protein